MYSIRRVEGEALDMEAEERNMQKKISGIITKKCEYLATMHLHTQVWLQLSDLQQFAVNIVNFLCKGFGLINMKMINSQ